MDTGGLAHMTYNNFASAGFNAPASGFASRGKSGNFKRLSVALPPNVHSIDENAMDSPLPRATSRSHLLAGLRTAPRSGNNMPASAPHSQSYHQLPSSPSGPHFSDVSYDSYPARGLPRSATTSAFGMNQYVMNAPQQSYSLPEQVLAPPSFYGHEDEIDPAVLEQLQLTGYFLAQRQQQLQQQLASITAAAAANQLQGMNPNMYQPQFFGQHQVKSPMGVPGHPGLYIVVNPATGQYEYTSQPKACQRSESRSISPLSMQQSHSMFNLAYDQSVPTFRAEISPPPVEKPRSRSITPPEKSVSPAASQAPVEPLPPPSANAFRRGQSKKVSSISVNPNGVPEGPKTASHATFGSGRAVFPPTPLTGTFGPGAARAGEHPIRQPRNPPNLEELVALPTANHEGSKNFAARRRRRALNNLVRAGSVRRGASYSAADSPTTSEGELSLNSSEADEPGLHRKQSPIGSERSAKRGSQSSVEGFGTGSAVQTPVSEDSNVFDMASFVKQLPPAIQQQGGQERRKMMLGVLTAVGKRKSFQA